MNKRKLIFYIIISMFLVACTGKNEKNISIKQKDKAPENLQKLNASLDKILDKAGVIEKIDLDLDFAQEEKAQDQENKSEEASNSNKKGDGKEKSNEESNKSQNGQESGDKANASSQGDGEKEKEESKADKLEKAWKGMDKDLEEVHSLWSSYEVEGMKKGASSERGNEFETSINKMTKAIENRSIIDTYDYGSQSILNLKSFWDLYTDDYRGDIAEIKYGVYQYYLRAINNDKNAALKVINHKDENISRIRVKVEDNEKKINELDEVSYSLKSLVNSLNEDSRRLYMIKKDTLIEKLKSLEES